MVHFVMAKSAHVLTVDERKKSIAGSSCKGKRKTVLHTLDSPIDVNWYVSCCFFSFFIYYSLNYDELRIYIT